MTKKRSLTVLVVVLAAAVVLTGGLMASNMGFKLNRALLAASDPGSASGTQTLALPYNRQVGIDMASDLFKDAAGKMNNLQKYDTATDGFVPYTFGTPDWPLVAGQGMFVKMAQNDNYIIVGSHDPSATVQLEATGAASKSGTNLYAPPYHGTAALASQLFVELGPTNVQNIQRWDTSLDSLQPYTYGLADYAINPGEAYFVKMAQTVAHSPSHY
jgi:hypothetical protein